MNGKGDRYRPVDQKKWDENYGRIYGDPIKRAIKRYDFERSLGGFNGRKKNTSRTSKGRT